MLFCILGSGYASEAGAGALGGEIVGVTSEDDSAIASWTESWLKKNPYYDVMEDNCQKFAYEFIVWLTGGVFTIPHR